MSDMKFDLLDILKEIYRRRKFVLTLTGLALVAGIIFSLIATKQYTSKSIIIVKSPEIMDRSRTYHTTNYDPYMFFATNDDVDNIVTIAKSDALAAFIVEKYNLIARYKVKKKDDAISIFKKKMKFTRGDTKNIEIHYTDTNADTACAITKDIVAKMEDMFRSYFISINNDMVGMLQGKIVHINDTLVTINQSIDSIRQKYNLYNVLLPTRGDAIVNSSASVNNPEKAEGMETLQQMVDLKDTYTKTVGEFTRLSQEYKNTMKESGMSMFYRVQSATLPDSPSSPILPLIAIICLVGGFIFSAALIVLMAFYKMIAHK